MLESTVKDNVLGHIKKYKLIKETQHHVVKNRSCLTNLLEYLAYAPDLDKVPHRRLMLKVKSFGIVDKMY